MEKGTVDPRATVTVNGKKTMPGRIALVDAFEGADLTPAQNKTILFDMKYRVTSKGMEELLSPMAKNKPGQYSGVAQRIADLGFRASYETDFTLGPEDIAPDKDLRDRIFRAAETSIGKRNPKSKAEADRITVEVYDAASRALDEALFKKFEKSPTSLSAMVTSGSKGKMNQVRQMIAAPGLLRDSAGRFVPFPVKKSYSEGLSQSDYWTTLHGARKGIIGRASGTAIPGAMSKNIISTTNDMVVTENDCGTTNGVRLSVTNRDVTGRYLSAAAKLKAGSYSAGTLITPEVLSTMKSNGLKAVKVRSPLTCESNRGVCQKCTGIPQGFSGAPELGTNMGILASQALGEPMTQMAMDSFHCNHAKSLVFLRKKDQPSEPVAATMEELFESLGILDEVREGTEQIRPTHGWEVLSERGWVEVSCVRRHPQERPMQLISVNGLGTICQDNHPLMVRENLTRCDVCGHHRLKKQSKSNRGWCVACKKAQDYRKAVPGALEIRTPAEIVPKRFFGETNLIPTMQDFGDGPSIDMDPWLAGMFVAEGSVIYHRSHAAMVKKKPYRVYISQLDMGTREKIAARFEESGMAPKIYERGVAVHNLKAGKRFEELFDRYSWNKKLPADFIRYPKEWLKDFICGLIDGDGTVKRVDDGPDQICIDTVSFALAQQVGFIVAKLGIVSSLIATAKRELTRHQGFRVSLRMTAHAVRVLTASYKVRNIEKVSPEQRPSEKTVSLVTNVRDVEYHDEWVYDLTTESGTLYVGGILSHNSGGVAGAAGTTDIDRMTRITNVLELPRKIKNSAILAEQSGEVTDITADPAGGSRIHIGTTNHYAPRGVESVVRTGDTVAQGDRLTTGIINPLELNDLTTIERTQDHLVDEIMDIYKGGLLRRNAETVVKAMTGFGVVRDPGNTDILPGSVLPTGRIKTLNRNNANPVVFEPLMKGITRMPIEKQEDWLARMQHRNLSNTLLDGVAEAWKSSIHGGHPIPALAYGAEFGMRKGKGTY